MIFYFSSTGNSIVVAKKVAERTHDTYIPISLANGLEEIPIADDRLGIISPVYHATFNETGVPYIVEDVIRKLKDIKNTYVYCILTHSGFPGFTLEHINSLLTERGGKLSAGLTVQLGSPYSTREKLSHIIFKKTLTVDPAKEDTIRKRLTDDKMEEISAFCEKVSGREEIELPRSNWFNRRLLCVFLSMQRKMAMQRYIRLSGGHYSTFRELTMNADRSFFVSKRCDGCGICSRVCPVGNIKIMDKNPRWLHKCENCYACFQWCPIAAINGDIAEFEKRHHHPDINLTDIMYTPPADIIEKYTLFLKEGKKDD